MALRTVSALIILAWASAAHAETPAEPVALRDLPEAASALFASAPVDEAVLARASGREQVNWLDATTQNTSVVSNNQVGANSTTGDVHVTDSAFQNLSGISIVNFNTGNNSSINAGMSVNLQITYAAPTP